eukprot:jgi/Tetstr1/432917/TSEL_022257.t1
MSWEDVQVALDAFAGLEAFLPAPLTAECHLAAAEAVPNEVAVDGDGDRDRDTAEPCSRLRLRAGESRTRRRCERGRSSPQPEGEGGSGARRVRPTAWISALRVLLKDGLPAPRTRQRVLLATAGRQLGVGDWGAVFEGQSAMAPVDQLPMPPRAAPLSATELGELVHEVASPSVGEFALRRALPALCARDGPEGHLRPQGCGQEGIARLAREAYKAAGLAKLLPEELRELLQELGLHDEDGSAGQAALQGLMAAYSADTRAAVSLD